MNNAKKKRKTIKLETLEKNYFFKKVRATKGKFHAKRGTIKDRNGMDLTARKFRKFSRSVVSDSLRPHVL